MRGHKPIRAKAGLALASLILAACAAPVVYGPIGAEKSGGFGYRDARNPDGSYTVLVVAPTPDLAHQFWDTRAAEICGGTHYRKNLFRADIPIVQYRGYASNGYTGGSYTVDQYGALQLEGYLRCNSDGDAPLPDAPPADTTASPP